MPDMLDIAAEIEAADREGAIRDVVRRAARPAKDWRKLSSLYCVDVHCGERIPDDRRRAIPGVKYCAECQARNERQAKRRAK